MKKVLCAQCRIAEVFSEGEICFQCFEKIVREIRSKKRVKK